MLRFTQVIMLSVSPFALAGKPDAARVTETIIFERCQNQCTALLNNTMLRNTCQGACDALQSQANEPCLQSLASATDENLALLSFSSGNYFQAAVILTGALLGGRREELSFIQGLHLNDRGSPAGCDAIEDAHYCVLQDAITVSLGLCLPRSCDSLSVARILGNITSPIGSMDSAGSGHLSGEHLGAPVPHSTATVVCGEESRPDQDVGTVLVILLICCLISLSIAGTMLDRELGVRGGKQPEGPSVGGMRPPQPEHARLLADERRLISSNARGHGSMILDSEPQDLIVQASGTDVDRTRKSIPDVGSEEQKEKSHPAAVENNPHLEAGHVRVTRPSEETMSEPLLGMHRSTPNNPRQLPLGWLRSIGEHNDTPSWWVECIMCFSLRKNFRKLIAPPRSTNLFGALDGIRTISTIWVIQLHTFFVPLATGPGITNMIEVIPMNGHGLLARFSAQVILGGNFAVDTFFFMSGFLASIALLPAFASKSESTSSWVLRRYWHRYVRLMPTTAFATLLYWQVYPYIFEGPAWWPVGAQFKEECRKYWWTEIAFVQNYVPWPLHMPGCMAVGWSLGVEMQFFLAAVPLIVLYHYRPNTSVITLLSMMVASCLYTLLSCGFYQHDYFFFQAATVPQWEQVYTSPFCRCPTYIIGLLCGMAWHTHLRGRDLPSINSWLADRAADIPLSTRTRRMFVPVALVISALLMLLPLYGSYWANRDVREVQIPSWAHYLYLAFARPSWTLGLALLCGLAFCGHGGFISTILTLPMWPALSQLTFACYLVHHALIYGLYSSRAMPFRYTAYEISITFMGVMVGSFGLSAVVHLLVEAPFRNLDSWTRRRRAQKAIAR